MTVNLCFYISYIMYKILMITCINNVAYKECKESELF